MRAMAAPAAVRTVRPDLFTATGGRTMTAVTYDTYGGSAAENYERYFVPAIGAQFARDLVDRAAPRPGERVLDVACGTGIVARLAAAEVGPTGSVAGLDVNPGMLGVAATVVPAGLGIAWHEASAEAMPLPDDAFDVVLCQMGLQFVDDQPAALREMRRVLAPGGRLVLNVPGPTPAPFAIMAEELATRVAPELAGFVHAVFSLHDGEALRRLLDDAGFGGIVVDRPVRALRLPPPADFLWQYVHSTPMADLIGVQDEATHAALQDAVVARWEPFVADGRLQVEVGLSTAIARNG